MVPKNGAIADVKFVPLIVIPVKVVATPAVSCSCTFTGKPDWVLVVFTAVATTFEASEVTETETVVDPDEEAKLPFPEYEAVIVLLPAARLLPLTVRVAMDEEPDAVSAADPSDTLPRLKVTVPAGAALPAGPFIVAVTCVDAVCAMLAALAVTVVVVATVGAVTTTSTVADEAANPVAPE